MHVSILKTKYVCYAHTVKFQAIIGGDGYGLGVSFETWGIRVKLIWWHVCIEYPAWTKRVDKATENKQLSTKRETQ